MEELKEWQIVELLKTTTEFFSARHVDEPRISSELLLAHVLGQNRLQLYLNHNRPVYRDELESFRTLCRQRLAGRPVQYITGEQFFYGMQFHVDERVLIPRPETELLVEHALESLSKKDGEGSEKPAILDIGTGSGCIAITMARLSPSLQMTAVDISGDALAIARKNAEKHDVASRITFVEADMFDDRFAEKLRGGRYEMIVSNPPYIPVSEWEDLQREVRQYEPALALTVTEGIECYRAVVEHSGQLLVPGGKICFELHADAAAAVSELLEANGFTDIVVQKDYSGHDRVISGTGPARN
jgi:release factor glutamine methyltransferase